jgi:drug/metabolite transporter (DMT)-like permease
MDHTPTAKDWLYLATLVICWGSAYSMMSIVGESLPPITGVALRVSSGFLIIYPFMRFKGQTLPPRKRQAGQNINPWIPLAGVAFFGNALPFTLTLWGLQEVQSGLAGIYLALAPLVTLVLANYFIQSEHMTLTRSVGFLMGFFGVCALVAPKVLGGDAEPRSLLFDLALLTSAISYGVSNVIAKKTPEMHPISSGTSLTLLSSLMTIPMALILEQPWNLEPTTTALILVVVLGIFSTALTNIVFFYALISAGASFVSLCNYMIPLWALLVGVIFMDESFSWNAVLALGLVLSGVWLSQSSANPFRSKRPG